MESMFSRKKTVHESEQMINYISVEEIREEIRRMALLEKTRIKDLEREKIYVERMKDCERLNQLIKAENEDFSPSVFEKPDYSSRENPYYKALVVKQEERE
jgi:hypothetical protein